MIPVQDWLDCCRRRLDFGEFLRVTAEWIAGWLCLFGSMVIVVKLFQPALWPHVLWLSIATIPITVFSWHLAKKSRHTISESAILLDQKLHTGGLLLALAESQNPHWERMLPANPARWKNSLPRIRPVRFFRLILLPLIFAIGACFVPLRESKTNASTPKRPGIAAVKELPAMLEDLKKANALTPEEEIFLQEEIDKLVKETADSPPTQEKWERIDAIRYRLRSRLEERYREIQSARSALRRLKNDQNKSSRPLTKVEKRQLESDIAKALKGHELLKLAKNRPEQTKPSPQTGKSKTAAKSKSVPPPKTKSGKTQPANTKTSREKTKETKTAPKQSPPTKSPSQKVPQPKTSIAKSEASNSAKSSSKTQKQHPHKTMGQIPPELKSLIENAAKKTPSSNSRKSGGNQQSDSKQPGNLPTNIPELSPEMIEQIARMIQAGKFKIPDNPVVREMMMRQIQKLLEQQGDKLAELKKKYGQQLQNVMRNGSFPLPNPNDFASDRNSDGTQRSSENRQPSLPSTGTPPPKKNVGFRDVVLPPGFLDEKKDEIVGVTGRRPNTQKFKPSVGNPDNFEGAVSEGETYRQRYRPRHRELIKRYFRNPGLKKP
ncbi:MAG: hypothetical protein Tsb009_11630 [Planctomycetaceae bacterium]